MLLNPPDSVFWGGQRGFISVNFVQFVLNSINLETKQVELGRLCHSFRDFPPVRTHILGLLSFERFLTWSKLRLGKLETTQLTSYYLGLGYSLYMTLPYTYRPGQAYMQFSICDLQSQNCNLACSGL